MSDQTSPVAVVTRARGLLKRLVGGAGYGCREIDRLIGKSRGFTQHLFRWRESLPLAELLAILDAVGVRYEDFFAEVLSGHDRGALALVRFEERRSNRRLATGPPERPDGLPVAQAPTETEEGPVERERHLAHRLERIKILIDQRILDLMEHSLGASAQLPPDSSGLAPALAERGDAP